MIIYIYIWKERAEISKNLVGYRFENNCIESSK